MPKIDSRNFQKLLEEKKSIAQLYTPEWDAADPKDTGVALLKIFTHMQEEIINRLNRMPEKNFVAFLEMIGLKLKPAQPARVPVTFYLPESFSGGIAAPSGTAVATDETEKHGSLSFETVNGIFVNSAAIEEVYCVDPANDKIFSYTDNFLKNQEFTVFEKENSKEESDLSDSDSSSVNKQEHILYLGHNELFNLNNPTIIELYFENGGMQQLKNYIWGFLGENRELKTIDSSKITKENNTLELSIEEVIKENEINGVKSYWLFCRSDKLTENQPLPLINKIKVKVRLSNDQIIYPDTGFCNQGPLALNEPGKFYIFGQQPSLFDTFYIANREAFSKKDSTVTLSFKRKNDSESPDSNSRTLLWEYWNGKMWYVLSLLENKTENFVIKDKVTKDENGDYSDWIKFNCPRDINEIEVNGITNYWIRVRLMAGDYGQNQYVKIPADVTTGILEHWEIQPNFKPPILNEVNIQYFTNEYSDLEFCFSYNDLDLKDLTHESKSDAGFLPFTPLPEKYPTLYLGFNDAFRQGNISIFFSLETVDYLLESRPKIRWTYWSKAPNLKNNVTNLKKITLASITGISSGTELLFEEKTSAGTITGTVIVDSIEPNGTITLKEELNYRYTKNACVSKRTTLDVIDNTGYLTTTGTLEFIGPANQSKTHKFGIESYWLMGEFIKLSREQLIKGIYPNTVWAEQVETIEDEILGSGDGEQNESFSFFRIPVISPEIWIRHEDIFSEDEEDYPVSEDIRKIKYDAGETIETWVRWQAVEDFADSGPRSRHYIIDRAMGMVQFGDGEFGMIPPIGQDNIKATYKTGGGVLGNVAKDEIKVLKSSISGIDHITNHECAEGGSDMELLSEIFERGPHLIKHRDRAVTKEDFERLAKAASSYIARTKCLIKENKLTIIVIPKGKEDRPQPSRGLREIVRKSLLERSLNMILEESLVVTGPVYIEIKVQVDIIPVSIDQAIPLERTVLNRLKEYLHPLTGGNEGAGWEFGRGVHISDVYSLLESIKGVDHVENLTLNGVCENVSIREFETRLLR